MNYEYTYETGGGGLFAGTMIVMWLFAIALGVLAIIGLWKTFNKAGLPGWAAIIPFYNQYTIVKMSNRPTWFFWAMLGCSLFMWIPILNFILGIALIVLWVFVALDIAANFGQGTGFAILLIIFPSIMFLVLGFGSAQYRRIAAPGSAGFSAPPMPAGGGYAAAPPPFAGTYTAPPAPPAPPAAAVTPAPATPTTATTSSGPVTPAVTVTPASGAPTQSAATDAAGAVPEAPAVPDAPVVPPAVSPPPPPPLV